MQIDAIQTRAPRGTQGQAVTSVVTDTANTTVARQQGLSARTNAVPVRGGLRNPDASRNENATAIQKAQAFLDAAQGRLAALKKPLADAVAGKMVSDEAIQLPLRDFTSLWRTRAEASAGSLDGQLRVLHAGEARQGFSVRGLDAQSLRAAEREQLEFLVRGRQSTTVVLEPGLEPATVARRVDQVLAPLGVRVGARDTGDLQFRCAETDWPAVRDSLSLRGSGRLFPAGQFNRVRSEAQPESVRPESWRVDDPFALRRTLVEVVQLGERLATVATHVAARLDELATPSVEDGDLNPTQAAQFAERFRSLAGNADFAALGELAPATAGLSRERVVALLNRTTST